MELYDSKNIVVKKIYGVCIVWFITSVMNTSWNFCGIICFVFMPFSRDNVIFFLTTQYIILTEYVIFCFFFLFFFIVYWVGFQIIFERKRFKLEKFCNIRCALANRYRKRLHKPFTSGFIWRNFQLKWITLMKEDLEWKSKFAYVIRYYRDL